MVGLRGEDIPSTARRGNEILSHGSPGEIAHKMAPDLPTEATSSGRHQRAHANAGGSDELRECVTKTCSGVDAADHSGDKGNKCEEVLLCTLLKRLFFDPTGS